VTGEFKCPRLAGSGLRRDPQGFGSQLAHKSLIQAVAAMISLDNLGPAIGFSDARAGLE
jgi:hypothetical protein